ncbi:FecR domain-containing protein [Candidatus Poribacteria bacterium]
MKVKIQIPSLSLWRVSSCIGLVMLFCFSIPVFGQQGKMITITIEEGQNIRGMAAQYLGDANLWTEILRVNNLKTVTEVKPGMKLKIPSNSISLAGRELASSLESIQEATKAGARIFAPNSISKAIQLRNEAIGKRKLDWVGCFELARSAKIEAQNALNESLAKNDISVEAILNDRRGKVESRKSEDLVWQDAPLHTTLVEREKIRTLSQSTAEILFRDESRLRLNENSQAIIQKMRVDLLKNRVESNVSLIEGDIQALLTPSQRKKFDLEVPGVEVKIKSTNFWINKDSETARIANYDGEIEVSAKDSTVVLGKNQGTKVARNAKPTRPEELLPPTKLVSPEHRDIVYRTNRQDEIALSWEPVEGAVSYWLEIANDRSDFQKVVLSRKNIREASFVQKRSREQIVDGIYYWRVSAMDKSGFPGVKSEVRLIKILTDVSPPYVLIHSPQEGTIAQESSIKVIGETEGDTVLTSAERSVDVSATGEFEFDVSLKEGINKIILEFTDRAGNVKTLSRSVLFMPYREIKISSDPNLTQAESNHFVAQNSGFTYAGRTEPEALVNVKAVSAPFRARTFSDYEAGDFAVSVPLVQKENDFDLSVTTRAGYVAEDRFTVGVDLDPPVINLDQKPPRVSKDRILNLSGSVIDGKKLMLNRSDIQLSDGRFDETIQLKPGKNRIRMTATDHVGNASFLEGEVIFDQTAPKLLKHDLSHKVASGGESVSINVYAEDVSGMKRAAKLTLQVGGWTHTDYLKFSSAMGCYQRVVHLPEQVAGAIKLKSVELEDYYGNKKQYQFE